MNERNILLIEDDYLDVIQIKRVLNKMDITNPLHIAHNGHDALKILKEAASNHHKALPSVILLDLNMPKMNGIEFLQRLREDSILRSLKVFIMTTSEMEVDKSMVQELGADGYIIKPFDYDKVDSTVDNFSLFLELLKIRDNN